MTRCRKVIDALAATYSEDAMQNVTSCALSDEMADDDVAHLAQMMANSGTLLHFRERYKTADIASTGGPSSLSTILCPLYLRSLGYVVPKVGVPGRPAGGVDVLAQVPGYKVDLTAIEMQRAVDFCGYAHVLAGSDIAPLDKALFTFRRDHSALAIPSLVIASILSKKLAVGIETVGLEVRVGTHCNFGSTWDEARANARRFCEVARLLDMEAVCFLTDASRPYQPFIGRGEALQALILTLGEEVGSELRNHALLCQAMARGLVGAERTASLDQDSLRQHTKENLMAQGATFDALLRRAKSVASAPVSYVTAKASGFLVPELDSLRECIVDEQQRASGDRMVFPDPCGVVLKRIMGEVVERGDVVATLRCDRQVSPAFAKRVGKSIRVDENPGQKAGYEEVRHA